jgi:peptidoglycan/LPS O-acetylase OafA/YrhL
MKYRADIDGLRSIAIIPVVLYHAGISLFSGGFVGVDVFFVISGYLITSIILNDIEKDKFTITQFYFRRIKRIFPALYFFFAVTTAVCFLIYMPADFLAYGKSLVGSVFFVSNIVFWRESGYFDTASELKPLLHTWSLSVEEQFYIFYPVMLLLLAKYFRKRYTGAVLVVFLSSLFLSLWATPKMAAASFFLLPTRAWELMLGALVALGFFPKTENGRLLNLLSAAGIFMIILSIFVYSHETAFPGYAALLPCIGTALIIYSGISSNLRPLVNRFLSLKPFVVIGLVSYSWYLWHWVVFAFRNYYDAVTVDSFIKSNSFLIALSLAIAFLSYFIIEKPFREVKWEKRKAVFVYAVLIMAVFGALGSVIYRGKGMPQRFSESIASINAAVSDSIPESSFNIQKGIDYTDEKSFFILGDKNSQPSFVLWGDSHAWAVAPGLDSIAAKAGISGYLFANSSSIPALNLVNRKSAEDRIEFLEKTLDIILSSENIKTVILSARWDAYINSSLLAQKNENGKITPIENSRRFESVRTALIEITELLQFEGKRVVFFSGVPHGRELIPVTVAKSEVVAQTFPGISKSDGISVELGYFLKSQEDVFRIFNELKTKFNPDFVYLFNPLCDKEICRFASPDGTPFFFDDDHLSTFGAKYICRELENEIIPLIKPE